MKKLISIFSVIVLLGAYASLTTGCSKTTNSAACIDALNGPIKARTPVTFTSSCSTPNITSYTWTFGDHTPSVHAASATHTYASPGTDTVTLTVVTTSGTSTTSIVVTVGNHTVTPQDFAGTYSVFDACLYTTNYNEIVTISNDTATIANMGNHGTHVIGTISASNITIPSQNYYTSGGFTWSVHGSGTLSANDTTLNITLTADSAFVSNTCNLIGTK